MDNSRLSLKLKLIIGAGLIIAYVIWSLSGSETFSANNFAVYAVLLAMMLALNWTHAALILHMIIDENSEPDPAKKSMFDANPYLVTARRQVLATSIYRATIVFTLAVTINIFLTNSTKEGIEISVAGLALWVSMQASFLHQPPAHWLFSPVHRTKHNHRNEIVPANHLTLVDQICRGYANATSEQRRAWRAVIQHKRRQLKPVLQHYPSILAEHIQYPERHDQWVMASIAARLLNDDTNLAVLWDMAVELNIDPRPGFTAMMEALDNPTERELLTDILKQKDEDHE